MAHLDRQTDQKRKIFSTLGLAGAIAVFAPSGAMAQTLVPDRTLGAESSVVVPDANVRGAPANLVEGGAARGATLFHSFSEFNIGTGERVYFANPIGIENILSRVTGANRSDILGTLGVNGSANLFLINPNGIYFGKDARLDIAGSLLASTADRFVLGNLEFSATNPQAPPLLSINLRPGLQYGAGQGATIANAGNLSTGQNLTLAAGNLDLQGQLQAGGNLTLRALDTLKIRDSATAPFVAAAGGELLVQGDRRIDIFALNHPFSGFFSGGNLTLRSAETIGGDAHYATRGSFRIEKIDGTPGSLFSPYDPIILALSDVVFDSYIGPSLHILTAGSVLVTGNIVVTGVEATPDAISPFNLATASLATVPLSDGDARTVVGDFVPTLDIRAGVNPSTVLPPGFIDNFLPFGLFTTAPPITPPAGITIQGAITVANGGGVLLTSYDPINPLALVGSVFVGGAIRAPGGEVVIDAPLGGIALAGGIDLEILNGVGGEIKLLAGAGGIDTRGSILRTVASNGNAGNVMLDAIGNIFTGGIQAYVADGQNGNGGNITLISRGGTIDTTAGTLYSSTTFGNSGEIQLSAAGDVFTAGIQSLIGDQGRGQAGAVTITSLFGSIDTTAFAPDFFGNAFSGIQSLVAGTNGNGGAITLKAQQTILLGDIDASSTSSDPTAKAGDITMIAGEFVRADGRTIDSSTQGAGRAGDIFVEAPIVAFSNQAFLQTDARTGSTGNAGDITIQTQSLLVTDGSEILSRTNGAGNAGNVIVEPLDPTLQSSASVTIAGFAPFTGLDANGNPIGGFSSGLFSTTGDGATGIGGTISITTGILSLSDDGVLSARTRSTGQGGDIIVVVNTLDITGGAQILAPTFNSGNAGRIGISAAGNVNISGQDPSRSDRFSQIRQAVRENLIQQGIDPQTADESALRQARITIDPVSDSSGIQARVEEEAVASPTNFDIGGIIVLLLDGSLTLEDGALISTSTLGQGNAGGILISAEGVVALSASTIASSVRAGAIGNAGAVIMNAGLLNLFNASELSASTAGIGDGGAILIAVEDAITIDDSNIRGTVDQLGEGNGGNIDITARSLTLSNAAQIQASIFRAANGNPGGIADRAGDVRITATDFVSIFGQVTDPTGEIFSSGLLVSTEQGARGQAGSITVTTNRLQIFDGGLINAQTRNASNAGDIIINANTMNVFDGGRILSSSSNTGNSGSIILQIAEDIVMQDIGQISVSSTGTGNPGNIEITADSLLMQRGSSIDSESASGAFANISLQLQGGIFLYPRDNQISAEARNNGSGGNITIVAPLGVFSGLSNNNDVVANAFAGSGGNISADAGQVRTFRQFDKTVGRTPESDFIASSELGVDGTVEIESQNLQELPELPTNLVDRTSLISQGCRPGARETAGKFTVTGRGGVPTDPNQPLNADAVVVDWVALGLEDRDRTEAEQSQGASNSSATEINEAQGWVVNENGDIVLIAQPVANSVLQTQLNFVPGCSAARSAQEH